MLIRRLTWLSVALWVSGSANTLWAQLPVTPVPPPTTIWSFLGIPQAMRGMRDGMSNKFGNHPALERKPPLKALADPANLKSDVPAIKAAAEIKQAEDLKPQKIKAVKYLAKVGCGCYDKDGKVTAALVAAMDDCTEDVRRAAVEAITEGAQGECCSACNQKSCCNEKVTEQLAKLAYERDDQGCYVEPSERIRQAAIQALRVCCPNTGPPAEPTPLGPGEIESSEGPGRIESTAPGGSEGGRPDDPAPIPPVPGIDGPAAKPKPADAPAADSDPVTQTLDSQVIAAALRKESAATASGEADGGVQDAVVTVDLAKKTAKVQLARESAELQRGQRLQVYRSEGDQYQLLGELEVLEMFGGTATLRPLGRLDLRDITAGAVVALP
jgi:hypothetical protein